MSPKPETLLIVDDDRRTRALLAARLEAQGYTVTVAANGQQALEMLNAQPCDLVLLDLMMPEMNGYQVIERLRADHALRQVPIIVISALEEMDNVVRCLEMGAADYLPKPFNPILLRARVEACLEKKRLQDQQNAYVQQLQAFNETLEQRVHEATTQLTASTQRLEQQLREMTAMSDVALALSSTMEVQTLLGMIMEKSKEVMQAEASSLLMLDQDASLLRFQVALGTAGGALQSTTMAVGQGIAGWVAQTGEPLLVPDAYQEPRFDPSFDQRTGFRTRSILTVPLKARGEVTGVVQVVNKRGQAAFDEHDMRLFQSFASQASVALENARLYEHTKAMAEDLRGALEQERRLTIEKEKMGAYLPKHVVDEISRGREQKLALGGKTLHLTILFSNLQGFTRLSEDMEPQRVVSFLNVYMTAMAMVIEAEGGMIDKFIGDSIMAIFVPQDPEDNHALRAVSAGIRMQQRLRELRQDWPSSHPEWANVQMRIGINSGEVVAGNIGSETRMDYTVVGDTVNVAARIQAACRSGEVCISESTYQDVKRWTIATGLDPIYVKNRLHPVQIYTVQLVSTGRTA